MRLLGVCWIEHLVKAEEACRQDTHLAVLLTWSQDIEGLTTHLDNCRTSEDCFFRVAPEDLQGIHACLLAAGTHEHSSSTVLRSYIRGGFFPLNATSTLLSNERAVLLLLGAGLPFSICKLCRPMHSLRAAK